VIVRPPPAVQGAGPFAGRRLRQALVAVIFALGCTKVLIVAPTLGAQADLLAAARVRPLADQVIGRFQLRLETERRSVTVPAVIVLDRPARGHVAVLGPLGGPMATLQTDGGGVAVALSRGRQHYLSAEADAIVADATGGALTLADLFGLAVGDPPLDSASETSRQVLEDGSLRVVMPGPGGAEVTQVFSGPEGVLDELVVRTSSGEERLRLVYSGYAPITAGGPLVPTDLTLELPPLHVRAELHAKSWTVPDVVPQVFGLAPPDGFVTRPLDELVDPLRALEGELSPP
jgi:hypothetical protein